VGPNYAVPATETLSPEQREDWRYKGEGERILDLALDKAALGTKAMGGIPIVRQKAQQLSQKIVNPLVRANREALRQIPRQISRTVTRSGVPAEIDRRGLKAMKSAVNAAGISGQKALEKELISSAGSPLDHVVESVVKGSLGLDKKPAHESSHAK
jgi:hypothetical protein